MSRFIPFLLLLLSSLVSAQVYKWVDADGGVHYSDEPRAGAKAITLPEISIYTFDMPKWEPTPKPKKVPVQVPDPEPEPEVATAPPPRVGYRSFRIEQPPNDHWITGEQPRLAVQLSLDPGLQGEDWIRLYLDGRVYLDRLKAAEAEVTGFAPGSHILEARVVDAAGEQHIRAKSVLFHYRPTRP